MVVMASSVCQHALVGEQIESPPVKVGSVDCVLFLRERIEGAKSFKAFIGEIVAVDFSNPRIY